MPFAGSLILFATSLTALSSLFLAWLSLWRGPQKDYLYFWVIVCLGVTVFAGVLPLAYWLPISQAQASLIFKLGFFAAIITCGFFVFFVLALLNQLKQKVITALVINLGAWFLLMIFIAFPQKIIKELKTQMGFKFYPLFQGWLAWLFLFWALTSFFYVLFILGRAFLLSQGWWRVQLKYIFLGLFLGVLGGASLFFSLFGLTNLFFTWPILLFPLGLLVITYGTRKRRLMEVHLVVSHALGYFFVFGIFLAVYAFFIFTSENLLKVTLGQHSWFVPGLMIILIAFLFEPFRRFIQKNLDRIFFRGGYEYPTVVLEAVEALVTKLRIEDLLNSLVSLAANALGVLKIGVLLPSSSGNDYRLEFSQGLDKFLMERLILPASHPMLRWLLYHNQIFVREEQRQQLSERDFLALSYGLEALNSALLVPLIFKGRLIGVLSVGEKTSGKLFSQQDINLLATISKQAAIALESARLYQLIRTSERAVGLEKQRTDAVINSLTDGLVMLNPKGVISLVNPAAERILGIHADLVLNKIPDPQMNALYQVLMEHSEQGPFDIEVEGPPARIVRVSAAPVRDFEGKSLGLIKILHDITRERLVDRMKSEFISIASHRLRTPLSAIKWSLSLLLQGDMGEIPQAQKDLLGKTFATNEHMIHLVNDLLNVARIEEGRIPYQYQRVQIADLIKKVANENKYQIKTGKLKLVISLPEKLPPKMLVDPDKVKTVLNVILDNAIKYTPAKGKIEITFKSNDEEIEVMIADTGVGIPKEQQANIFTKFFRGDNVVRMQTEGTGLGLFLSKTIIERHGGRIWFESQENKGTKFFITLPLKSKLGSRLQSFN